MPPFRGGATADSSTLDDSASWSLMHSVGKRVDNLNLTHVQKASSWSMLVPVCHRPHNPATRDGAITPGQRKISILVILTLRPPSSTGGCG